MSKQLISTKQYEEDFNLFANLAKDAAFAGQRVRDQLKVDPNYIENFCEMFPQMMPGFLRRLSNVGVREVPALFWCSSSGAQRLRQLPLDVQEKFASEPLTVFVVRDGEPDASRLIGVNDLTPEQAAQVFASDHIRDVSEQRNWLEAQRTKKAFAPKKADVPYRAVKDELVTDTLRIKLADIIKAFGKETVLMACAKQ